MLLQRRTHAGPLPTPSSRDSGVGYPVFALESVCLTYRHKMVALRAFWAPEVGINSERPAEIPGPSGVMEHETRIPAIQKEATAEGGFPGTDVDGGGTEDNIQAPPEGPGEAQRIRNVDHACFRRSSPGTEVQARTRRGRSRTCRGAGRPTQFRAARHAGLPTSAQPAHHRFKCLQASF